jgi:hypothetical protein
MEPYLVISYAVTFFMCIGLIAYLTEECLGYCIKEHHKQHKIVAILLLTSPLWGWLMGFVAAACLSILVGAILSTIFVGPFIIIHEVLKKNTD